MPALGAGIHMWTAPDLQEMRSGWESGALRSYVRCAVRCDRQPRWSPRIGSQHVCGHVKAGDALGFSRSLDRPITTIFPSLASIRPLLPA